jgi:alcohol dehydrogenase, propanol-preferring
MATMQAFQFVELQKPAELREVKVPEPGPGQVLIKIGGAGACHSDLHILEMPADTPSFPLPFTLGHENAGWVERLGSGTTGFAIGDPMIVYGPWGCGTCANCRVGMENYCENAGQGKPGGLGRDGGMANYTVVPSTRFLLPPTPVHHADKAPGLAPKTLKGLAGG